MDNKDNGSFDLFLMYTGGATFDGGHSMLRKINVQVSKTSDGPKHIKTLTSEAFGEELFKDTVPPGHDVGGDHAWVDESGGLASALHLHLHCTHICTTALHLQLHCTRICSALASTLHSYLVMQNMIASCTA